MQSHTLDTDTAESLLQDHSDVVDRVLVLSRSPGYRIHFNSCNALADIYKEALQKLSSLLTLDITSHEQSNIDASQELQLLLQPPLDMLLAAIRQGMLFLESCTPSLPRSYSVNLPRQGSSSSPYISASSVFSDAASTSSEYSSADELSSWLHKALIMGLASDVADVHLHDLLIAFCAVATAMEVYNNKLYMRDPETRLVHRPPMARRFVPSPDLFWKEQNKPHVLLVSGTRLDNVKENDELFLTNPKLLLTKPPDAIHTESVAKLVAVMEETVKCSKQAFQESISPSVFLNIDKDLDSKPDSIIYTHEDPNGATATVRKASWLGKEFALKMYKKQAEAMFLQEASVHIRLHHPNVVHAIALFQGKKKCGILMERMDGTLKNFWQKHRIKLQDKVKIMLQIANGMEYIHRRGLIHRDLKTSNVLVSSCNMDISASTYQQINVKIADFGTAKPRAPNSSSFTTKKIGTHVFRAPEVLNDDAGAPSYRKSADVYSFAMTCFELLAEEEPFQNYPASSHRLVFQRIREGERPDLASISDAAFPPYLKHCFTNWWDGNPDTRHSFAHICSILRHLYACLASCQSGEAASTQQFPFLAWPLWRWKHVQDIALQKMHQFNDRRGRDDWQRKGYVCKCTRVNEIPYEMHVMDWAIKEVAAIPHEVAEASNEVAEAIPHEVAEASNEVAEAIPHEVAEASDEVAEAIPHEVAEASNKVAEAIPHEVAEASNDRESVQPASRSFGQKLKKFCCFSAQIAPSTHEAFHDHLVRRN